MHIGFQAHPWHGISPGDQLPQRIRAFIEIVPTDAVKYEVDKASGHLMIDRPQKYSNLCPTLYGFIPRTYCGQSVGELCSERTGRSGIVGDGDPLDICVITEKPITHGNILVQAIPIGGLRMIDGNEADDKILAVLHQDAMYGAWHDLQDCPAAMLERLSHYFLTYKDMPGVSSRRVEIPHIYGAEEAYEVIRRSLHDYETTYGATYPSPQSSSKR